MSEPVLRALMQLFALISDIGHVDEISVRERNVVRSFLARHLNNELVEKYIRIFDEYLDLFTRKEAIKERSEDYEIEELKIIRIKRICEGINSELRQKQKIYIIIQLIDFISYGKEITENELDFLMMVALAINITENEYKNIKSFIIDPVSKIPEKDKLLIINSNTSSKFKKIRHIYNPRLSGDLRFLHIASTKNFILRYSGDKNLYLNGQHIFPNQSYLFDNGSTVKGQGLGTIYYSELYDFFIDSKIEARISFSANGVTYLFADSENGIQDFNFHEESGQLVGIMGLSGTGKSTLLNLLNGNLKPQKGNILINGYDINNEKQKKRLKGLIGYIPQDDLLIEELTVYQNLYYNARLCLSNLPVNKIKKVVTRLMIDLDLWDVKHLRVGNPLDKVISGGQRKRINIGLELLREPYILFVDEPTSGLSSVDSEVVINLLKEQTYKGRLVIVNIHQPCSDIFKLFDKVIILDKGGYQIFYGNPNEAVVHFKTYSRQANPEEDQCTKCGNINTDQILQIVEAKIVDENGKLTQTRKVSPEEWAGLYKQKNSRSAGSGKSTRKRLPENFYSIPGKIRQMQIFFTRDILSKLANKQYILISLLGAPLLALLLGYFTRYSTGDTYEFIKNDNLTAYLFMCVITSMFLGLIISSEEILKDRKILKRESFLNLSWLSYINSKIIILFMISAIQSILFILVGNTILGIKGMTFQYWLVLFTTASCANMIGLNLSSALNSVITIYILIPFILIPQLLFSGVLVKYDKLNLGNISSYEYVPFIGEVMPARWSFEALAVEQFKNNKYEKIFFPYDMRISTSDWNTGFLIPALEEDLHKCINSDKITDSVSNNIRKLDTYIGKMFEEAGFLVPEEVTAALTKERLDTVDAAQIQRYLTFLRDKFYQERKKANNQRDSISRALTTDYSMGKEDLIQLKTDYCNEWLSTFVLNTEPGLKCIEKPKRIIRKFYPGYMEPTANNGRAHFCAPFKIIGNTQIDTFWFNLGVIWALSVLLYMALYFNILQKIVLVFSGGILNRKSESRFLIIKEISPW
jgi:ABC-type multidrug transport system ATPase subunit